MKLKSVVLFCLELLFPPRCIFCGRAIAPGTKVCSGCTAEVSPVNTVRCMNLPGTGKNIRCAVLYSYEGRARQSVIRFKFYGEKKYADFYAEKLAELVRKNLGAEGFDLVTAVPVSQERRKARGYNQSELLARRLARELSVPYEDCLVKLRDNPEQHSLSRRDRLKNVRGVYRALPQASGKRILLVDDIVTTGSTLLECARVLYGGGAGGVGCAAVAQVGTESG